MTTEPATPEPEHKPRPFVDLLVSILIPSVILMKLSGDDKLGATGALILALAFPIGWGLYELISHKHRNWIALLGVVSVLLTGGIGLLKIDAQWLAIKEAAVPSVIGLGVLIAHKMGYPIIRKLLLNPSVFNVEKIEDELNKRNNKTQFENRLDNANYLLAGTFVFSAVMNYTLAKWIVKSESGTTAFNEELGRMTLLSYPMIAIPSMIMMLCIFFLLWRTIKKLTGLTLEDIMIIKE
ncbi:MAG: MFS transporter [Granulosicoccus sp.]|nr:MFS transporter [Granulosicoccus sp.]